MHDPKYDFSPFLIVSFRLSQKEQQDLILLHIHLFSWRQSPGFLFPAFVFMFIFHFKENSIPKMLGEDNSLEISLRFSNRLLPKSHFARPKIAQNIFFLSSMLWKESYYQELSLFPKIHQTDYRFFLPAFTIASWVTSKSILPVFKNIFQHVVFSNCSYNPLISDPQKNFRNVSTFVVVWEWTSDSSSTSLSRSLWIRIHIMHCFFKTS